MITHALPYILHVTRNTPMLSDVKEKAHAEKHVCSIAAAQELKKFRYSTALVVTTKLIRVSWYTPIGIVALVLIAGDR